MLELMSVSVQKAVDHAKLRISQGKSPFKEANEQDVGDLSDEELLKIINK